MKHSLITFFIFVGLFGCRENSPKNNIEIDSIRKVTDIPLDTVKQHGNTLDSLQGIWISNADGNDHLLIQSHNHAEIFTADGRSDTAMAEFYLTDSCEKNMNKLDIKKSSGNVMMLTMPDDPVNMLCYKITYLDDKHLALIFQGKTLSYYKK